MLGLQGDRRTVGQRDAGLSTPANDRDERFEVDVVLQRVEELLPGERASLLDL